MVGKTELFLICLVAVALLAIVARKIRVPYPILLTIGGVVLALVPGLPAIQLDPQLVFNLFLPPLLYPAAVYTSWRDFRANLRQILPLAIVLVLLTMTAAAYLLHYLVGLPLAVGFVFGAIISPSAGSRRRYRSVWTIRPYKPCSPSLLRTLPISAVKCCMFPASSPL